MFQFFLPRSTDLFHFLFVKLFFLFWAVIPFFLANELSGQNQPTVLSLEERIEKYDQVLRNAIYYRDYPVWGYVRDMVKDHEGFLWIGAEPGLVRFDGKQFKKFLHNPKDSTSLSNDNIFRIWVDSLKHEIWFGTGNGISVLDTKTNKFRRYLTSNSNLPDVYVRSIYGDRQGQIWIGTQKGGLLEYDTKADTFIQQFHQDSIRELPYQYTYAVDILQDRFHDSILWLGTGYGLVRWNKKTKQYKRYIYQSESAPENIHKLQNISQQLYQHEDGRVYSANYRGINIFDPQTEQLQHVDPYGGNYNDGRARYSLRRIGRWTQNELFVTLRNGFAIFDLEQQKVLKIWKNKLRERYYTVMTKDEEGNWWGISEIGLIQFPAVKSVIDYYYTPRKGRNTAIHKMVLLEDEAENAFYIGTAYNDGLLRLDLGSGTWMTIPPNPEYTDPENFFMIMDGDLTPEGEVIIAEYSRLFQLSKGENTLEIYPVQPQIDFAHYRSLLVANNGHIWAGTQSEGLVRIQPEQDTFIIYKEELNTLDNPNHYIRIWELFEDSKGRIWIRTAGGYSIYLPEKNTFVNLTHQDSASIAFLYQYNFAEDNLGRVWFSGDQEGVGYSLPDQLQNGMDTLLLADRKDLKNFGRLGKDKNGNIWASVDHRGWLKIDPNTLNSKLIPGHWIHGRGVKAFKLLSNGQLAIGYATGLIVLDPDVIPEITEIPKPYLDELLLFNKPFSLDSSLLYKKQLRLNYDQNFLTFRFGAISYYDGKFTKIKYRLLGSHAEWFEPGEVLQASYSNLSPGHYTFEIQAKNNAGLASLEPYRLYIQIIPPWWKSPWAYAGYTLLLLGLFYTFYQFQLQKKLAEAEAARLLEMDQFKSQMYTNLTHEFRTPLTLIMGLADEVLENGKFKLTERVRMIRKNGEQLLNLINQLLDLRKLETGHLELHPEPGDLAKYLNYLVESFQSLAAAKHIRLIYYADPESLPMLFDEEKIKQVISNLLSNAIKFTPDYGKITVGVSKGDEQTVIIKVKDTGIGIPKGQISKIFDRFYQVDATATRKGEGTGVGLALTQELIHLMKGTITVESTLGKGSHFMIKLPYQAPQEMVRKTYQVQQETSSANISTPFSKTKGALVLLVEDNQDVIYYLQTFLGNTYQIEKAFNGKEGLEKGQELIPDIIISDVMMPEMDGMEMAALLKQHERTSHIPIIMLTAKVTQQDKEEGLDKGVDAYLSKPFQKEELLIRIQRLLESRQRLQEKYAGNIGLLNSSETDDTETAFLKKLNQAIEQHFADDQFGVQELCRAMAMSRTQLHRKITALTNQSTSEWIRRVRLNKARALLLHTDLPIGEVAVRVGFKDASHFTKVFQQTFNVLPSEIRKQ